MKMHYRTGQMVFEIEGETAKELFKELGEIQSIFEADKACGRCKSERLHCRVRTVEEGDYYELLCRDCLSTLALGQTRAGSLFAKRKDKDGNILDKNGWRVPYGKTEHEPVYADSGRA